MQTRHIHRRRVRPRRAGMTTVEFVIVLCLIGALSVGLWRSFGSSLRKRLGQADTEIYDNLRAPSKTSSVDATGGG